MNKSVVLALGPLKPPTPAEIWTPNVRGGTKLSMWACVLESLYKKGSVREGASK